MTFYLVMRTHTHTHTHTLSQTIQLPRRHTEGGCFLLYHHGDAKTFQSVRHEWTKLWLTSPLQTHTSSMASPTKSITHTDTWIIAHSEIFSRSNFGRKLLSRVSRETKIYWSDLTDFNDILTGQNHRFTRYIWSHAWLEVIRMFLYYAGSWNLASCCWKGLFLRHEGERSCSIWAP